MDLLAPLTAPVITLLGMPMSAGDLAGFATGIACVWLTARASIWNFPLGIANSAILGLVFLQQRLFADASLQIVFIALSVQGWLHWLSGRHAVKSAPVFASTARELQILAACGTAIGLTLWLILVQLRGAAPPIDAAITAMSLCAQWLLNQRKIANWYWWIAVDLISIPLYWSRGLPLIALLYVVFLGICVQGLLHWRQRLVPAGAPA